MQEGRKEDIVQVCFLMYARVVLKVCVRVRESVCAVYTSFSLSSACEQTFFCSVIVKTQRPLSRRLTLHQPCAHASHQPPAAATASSPAVVPVPHEPRDTSARNSFYFRAQLFPSASQPVPSRAGVLSSRSSPPCPQLPLPHTNLTLPSYPQLPLPYTSLARPLPSRLTKIPEHLSKQLQPGNPLLGAARFLFTENRANQVKPGRLHGRL